MSVAGHPHCLQLATPAHDARIAIRMARYATISTKRLAQSTFLLSHSAQQQHGECYSRNSGGDRWHITMLELHKTRLELLTATAWALTTPHS